jgi:hypothetical protein
MRRCVQVLFLLALVSATAWAFVRGPHCVESVLCARDWRDSAAEPNHPWVREIAAHVVAIEPTDSAMQIALIQEAVLRLVRYSDDRETWGVDEHFATIDEILSVGLRGDCDDRATVAVSIAQALGLTARLETSRDHAWASVLADGRWVTIGRGTDSDARPWSFVEWPTDDHPRAPYLVALGLFSRTGEAGHGRYRYAGAAD